MSCESAEALAEVEAMLPPDWRPCAREPSVRFELAGGRVRQDGVEYFHGEVGRQEPVARLAAMLRHRVAEFAPAHAFIHAGVVAVSGRAIVIPARSQSGKTTLVRALVERGAQYCSDEYAVVDAAGLVHPYPKALTVRTAGVSRLGVPVAIAGDVIVGQPIAAGLIVLTRYEAERQWEPVECSAGEGSIALLDNTVGAQPRPGQSLAAAAALTRSARVLSGPRGDAGATAEALLAWVADVGFP